MRWRVAVFGTLGTLATLVAVGFVLAPEALLAVGPVAAVAEQLSATDPKLVMLAATLVVGLYAVVAARSSGERSVTPLSAAEQRFDRAVTEPPEAVTADRRTLAAADINADVRTAIESGGAELRAVRAALSDLVVEAYTRRYRVRRAQARDVVATGDWTEDRTAAVFLGEERGPQASLFSRVRLWLTPERERERRIARTLAELTALAEGEP